MMGTVVLALIAIAVIIALAVFSTVATSARARKEATEAFLLARMQAALGIVAEHAAASFEFSDDDLIIDLAAPHLVQATADFSAGAAQMQTMIDAEEARFIAEIGSAYDEYLETVAFLANFGDSSFPSGSLDELRNSEDAIRAPLLDLQLEENEHLLDSIEEEARAVLILQRLVPGLLVLAALLTILAIRLQLRSRHLEELEALYVAKDGFIASVSHELRTPLTAVVGMAAELRDRTEVFDPDEVVELATIIADQSNEVSYIVEDLLVAARIDAGSLTVVLEPVGLRRQVEDALVPFRALLPSGCQLIGDATAYADGGRVRQILRNLIGNAVRHGGDRITVRIQTELRGAVVIVEDDGQGLPASEWEAIFEAYHRARDIPGLPPSVGLGLTVSRQLARQMSGDLSYRYADGFSRFELVLQAAGPTGATEPVVQGVSSG